MKNPANSPANGKSASGLAVAVLFLVVLAVYGNSLRSGFVWDDDTLIVQKQAFFSQPRNALVLLASPDTDFRHNEATPYYRPLNTLTYVLDSHLWGLDPFWYHLENLLLHASAVVLFYLLLAMAFEDKRLAFFSALLFALYPVNAEAVDFVSARNTLLCAVFLFASLFFLGKSGLFLKKGGLKWSLLALLSYFLALMSKEPAVVAPLFLLSFTLTTEEEKFRVNKSVLIGLFAITGVYFLLRHIVLGAFTSKAGMEFSLSRLKFIAAVYFENFRLMLFPFRLNALYTDGEMSFGLMKAAGAVSGLSLLLYLSLAGKKFIPAPVRAGAQWVFWGLLPVSNIVKIPSAPVAERYQYTIIPGFVLILGYLIVKLHRRKAAAGITVMAALSLALGARTFERNFVWRDTMSLCSSMVRSDPASAAAHDYLGQAYIKNKQFEEAAVQCRTAIALDPDYAGAHVNLGMVYGDEGRSDDALKEFLTAVRVDPELAEAHLNLGIAYVKRNMMEEAEKEFKTVIKLNPNYTKAYVNLGLIYAGRGDLNGASREFEAALKLDPLYNYARMNLGVAYAEMGRLDEAMVEFGRAERQDPGLVEAHLFLGIGYEKEGRMQDAAREFREVLRLAPGNAPARNHLDSMGAENGGG
ncbi:MAG: tetratricopeptide repeat protein [Nitrospiraceae bacterium]|nr:tetratricopeptide repeat protein [Nitrospiraceae bacterium]